MPSSPLNVHLEQYEGPLDLLLDLIRKQEINIYDIPIARITAQYLEYMQQAVALDVELGAEFVLMAATLIHIKSRTLLPRDPALEEGQSSEDPRQELVQRLLEHERYKNAAEMLQEKRVVEEAMWSNPQIDQFLSGEEDPGLAVTLFDLIKTLQEVLERAKNRPIYQVNQDDITVPVMIERVSEWLRKTEPGESLSLVKLFEQQRSRRAMICLFLAILEMVRMQAVALTQKDLFGEIAVKRHKKFEEALAARVVEAVEEEYK